MIRAIVNRGEAIIKQSRLKKSVRGWSQTHWQDKAVQKRVMKDYLHLYQTKGLEMGEYRDFEFENRSEEFRKDFLGIREQRYYLELLNPFKYFIFARNKFAAHKFFENTGIRTSELYCYYDPEGVFVDSQEIASSVVDVVRILKNDYPQNSEEKFCHIIENS